MAVKARAESAQPPAATGRPKKGTSIAPLSKGGNDRLTARIARDRPDVLEKMKAGEFTSVRQAAIAAGIVRVPTPLEAAKKAVRRLSEEDRGELARWMDAGTPEG